MSSTAVGGGVAEMVRSLLAYARGAGVDARWVVIDGTPEFFRLTKRIHNAIHGSAGDGSPLGDGRAGAVRRASRPSNAGELAAAGPAATTSSSSTIRSRPGWWRALVAPRRARHLALPHRRR